MKIYFLLFIAFFAPFLITGQNNNTSIIQNELDSGSIESRFNYIINKSSRYNDFQLIRRTSILKVRDYALDSLTVLRKSLINANNSVNQLQSKGKKLANEIITLENDLALALKEKGSVSFLGKMVHKTTYNIMVWSFIAVLLLILLFLALQFKKNQFFTKKAQEELSNMEEEFNTFRKKSLKKEQEIMRKLQNEINKNQ